MAGFGRVIAWCVIVAGLAGCAHRPGVSQAPPLAGTPAVLIIGDSISMEGGYLPGVVERLADRYRVVHNPGNGGDSANVLAHLDTWVSAVEPDIIHFNCGLHDIKLDRQSGTRQQEPDAYERNLREMVRRLKTRTQVRLVFALTTPVNEEWHHENKPFDRRRVDVEAYNAIARRVMSESGVPVSDLHKVIADAGVDTCLVPDGVHMNARGNALLAEAVAATIERVAGRKSDG